MGIPRIFTNIEEEEYIQLSRRPDVYELFAQSIAPSIYGNSGTLKLLTIRYQKGHCLPAIWRQ
jgi:DNA replicative helicase MCM subunit Mcm2 (Cdc46/Mcm family)